MSVEELLKPRYKVIADYPGCTFSIGEICEPLSKDALYYSNKVSCEARNKMMSKYPHIFKPLAWYEERDVKDMPLYLKDNFGEVFKVSKYSDILPVFYTDAIETKGKWKGSPTPFNLKATVPATEQEYLTYINSNQK